MDFSKRIAWLCLLGLAALLLVACSRSRETDKVVRETVLAPQTVVVRETVLVERIVQVTPTPDPSQGPVTLHLNLAGDPLTIDPSLVTAAADLDVVGNLFLGLTRFDAQGMVEPELASAWTVSEDGLRWTFTLREDVRWVSYRPSSGVATVGPVTAGDVVYAVRRSCDPRTGSELASVNYIITGCEALHNADLAGRSAEEIEALAAAVGVTALDDSSVEFTLNASAGYFPAIAGLPLNWPLYQPALEQAGERWTEAGNIVTNGPYVLAGWFHGDYMALQRNPLWPDWNQVTGNVEQVELAMAPDDSELLARYREGRLDSIKLPSSTLDDARADPVLSQELAITPLACTEYVGFTNSKPPLDDPLVRKALSAAIDRQALVEQVTRGGEIPANTFAPSMVFGSAAGDPSIAPWALPEAQGGWGYTRALAQAQAWLADAGYPGGQGLPPLTLWHNAAEGPARTAQAIAAMWRAGLGVDVVVESRAWSEYWSLLNGGADAEQLPHAWRMAYCGDYPDQNNWLHQVFNTNQGADRLRWEAGANAALAVDGRSFNQLTEAAQQSVDPGQRRALYREAERILNDAVAAYAPVYHYTAVDLAKPYLQRSYDPGTGQRLETWTLDWLAKQATVEP